MLTLILEASWSLSFLLYINSCLILSFFSFFLPFNLTLWVAIRGTPRTLLHKDTGSVSPSDVVPIPAGSCCHHQWQAVQPVIVSPLRSDCFQSCHNTTFTHGEPTEQRGMNKVAFITRPSRGSGNRTVTTSIIDLTAGCRFLTVFWWLTVALKWETVSKLREMADEHITSWPLLFVGFLFVNSPSHCI